MLGPLNPQYGKKGELSPNFRTQRSEETKRRMSLASSANNNAMYGKHHTDETKLKMSINNTGKYIGELHPNARLTWEKIKDIRNKYALENFTLHELGKLYGVSFQHISDIVNNKSWIDLSYTRVKK
ncbi:MAG: NUMOD3 domain-containing DNA-binding protein [Mobilitalea sp.]